MTLRLYNGVVVKPSDPDCKWVKQMVINDRGERTMASGVCSLNALAESIGLEVRA